MIAFIGIEGNPPLDQKKDPPIGIGTVSPEYFQTMKIPLLSGRQYDARDGADGQKVAIVNQAFANRFFPNGDSLGKRVSFGCEESEGLCRTIVGVVGNIRQESITDEVDTRDLRAVRANPDERHDAAGSHRFRSARARQSRAQRSVGDR